MTRETLRDQLIASGAIRPAGHGRKSTRKVYRTDHAGIRSACAQIVHYEGLDIARVVVANPAADLRVRALLSRAIESRAAA